MKLPFYLEPLGAYKEILAHPYDERNAIEVAVFHEHRLAFYYWADWTKGIISCKPKQQPPVLVTLDWHEDTAAPEDVERRQLRRLDLSNLSNIAFFSWARLHPHNDGHILSAAYLNLVSDIFVVCKQPIDDHQPLKDRYGNIHRIYSYHSLDDMLIALNQYSGGREIYFDLDLDYFTESDDPCGGGDNVTLVPTKLVQSIMNPNSLLMQAILPRLAGMTIALEPEFCGGFVNSHFLLQTVESSLFNNHLGSGKVTWKV